MLIGTSPGVFSLPLNMHFPNKILLQVWSKYFDIFFFFTIKETRIDYHNYIVYSQLASGVGEQLKIVVVIVTAATVVSFQLVLQKLIQWYTLCLNVILIMLMQHFGTLILHMKVTSGRTWAGVLQVCPNGSLYCIFSQIQIFELMNFEGSLVIGYLQCIVNRASCVHSKKEVDFSKG